MATVTVVRPKVTDVVLNISVEQAFELLGLLGRGRDAVGGLFGPLYTAIETAGLDTHSYSNPHVKRGRDLAPQGLVFAP